jgi:hypothetical protein
MRARRLFAYKLRQLLGCGPDWKKLFFRHRPFSNQTLRGENDETLGEKVTTKWILRMEYFEKANRN